MKNLPYILTIILMGSSLLLSAQNPDLPGGEVEVIKNFDARLLDAEKLDITPSLPPLDTATKTQTYLVPAKTITVDYLPPTIRPIAMSRIKPEPGYNGYAKLGAGLPVSFFGDVSYNIFAQEQYDVGINLKHHSASNNKKVENQKFSYSAAGLDGTYYSDKGFAVNGALGYTVDDEYLYGYNFDNPNPADTAKLADEVRQRYSTFGAKAKIFNGEQTVGDFNYSAGVDFYFLTDGDLSTSKESGVDLTISGTKWFAEKHPLNITLKTDFTNFRTNSVEKQTLNNFFLKPSFTYHADLFKLKIGANIASHDDEFAFLPDAEFSINLIGSALSAFIGAKGDLHKNNFRNVTDYNPYVVSEFDIRNTRELEFYGGVRGNAGGYTYLAKAGYTRADDLALYLTDNNDISRFNIVYDTVGIFTIGGNIGAEPFKGLEVLGGANFSVYTAANELRAWHLPALEVNFMAKYKTMEDKLTVKGELFIENGVPYLDNDGLEDELNGLFDISLGVEYQVSKNFGAFFDVYNLAGNKRQRWYRYPTFGINVLGGIVLKF